MAEANYLRGRNLVRTIFLASDRQRGRRLSYRRGRRVRIGNSTPVSPSRTDRRREGMDVPVGATPAEAAGAVLTCILCPSGFPPGRLGNRPRLPLSRPRLDDPSPTLPSIWPPPSLPGDS